MPPKVDWPKALDTNKSIAIKIVDTLRNMFEPPISLYARFHRVQQYLENDWAPVKKS
jgi:hypothetical protein